MSGTGHAPEASSSRSTRYRSPPEGQRSRPWLPAAGPGTGWFPRRSPARCPRRRAGSRPRRHGGPAGGRTRGRPVADPLSPGPGRRGPAQATGRPRWTGDGGRDRPWRSAVGRPSPVLPVGIAVAGEFPCVSPLPHRLGRTVLEGLLAGHPRRAQRDRGQQHPLLEAHVLAAVRPKIPFEFGRTVFEVHHPPPRPAHGRRGMDSEYVVDQCVTGPHHSGNRPGRVPFAGVELSHYLLGPLLCPVV